MPCERMQRVQAANLESSHLRERLPSIMVVLQEVLLPALLAHVLSQGAHVILEEALRFRVKPEMHIDSDSRHRLALAFHLSAKGSG